MTHITYNVTSDYHWTTNFLAKGVDAKEIFIKTFEGMMTPEPWKN
jgi:hypothetical protein